MKTKSVSITTLYEPTLSDADWHTLHGARFAALPQAVQKTLRSWNLPDAAQLVFQDLFALAVRDRFEGNLALKRPRRMLESLSNKSRSTYSRLLATLEKAGLIVRRMTRHPATRYAQGWTVIVIRLPAETWQAMREDQYRDGKPSETRPAASNPTDAGVPTRHARVSSQSQPANRPGEPSVGFNNGAHASIQTAMHERSDTSDQTDPAGPSEIPSGAPSGAARETPQGTRHGDAITRSAEYPGRRVTDPAIDTPPAGTEPRGTGDPDNPEASSQPAIDRLETGHDVLKLWRSSEAAFANRVMPFEEGKPIVESLIGLELTGGVEARRSALLARLDSIPESREIKHTELARHLADESVRRTTPDPPTTHSSGSQPTCLPSDLMQAIRERAGRVGVGEWRTVLEIGYSVACGVFRWHDSRDRAIGSALKVVRSGRWQTPFGFDSSLCQSQHDGSVVFHA